MSSTRLNRSLRCDTPAGWPCTAAVVHRVLLMRSILRPGARVNDVQAEGRKGDYTVRTCVSPAMNNKKQGSFEAESSI